VWIDNNLPELGESWVTKTREGTMGGNFVKEGGFRRKKKKQQTNWEG